MDHPTDSAGPGRLGPDDDRGAVVVRRLTDENRFTIAVGPDVVGRADYRDGPGGVRTFTHTEVDPTYGGRGLASVLIRQALDQTRAAGLRIRPLCPFVSAFVDSHPDYAYLVAESAPGRPG